MRHTVSPDDGEGIDRDPRVVGFAGPFFLGRLGEIEPVWAIMCTMRIFKEDAALAKRYPRVSVEYWASKDDPTDGHFDPISLLGAETPELDLGIRYQRPRGAMMLRHATRELTLSRYEAGAPAASPSGGNGFVPSFGTGGKKSKQNYSKEAPAMALSTEEIQQIVEGLKPTIETIVDDRLAFLMPEAEEPMGEVPPNAAAGAQRPAD